MTSEEPELAVEMGRGDFQTAAARNAAVAARTDVAAAGGNFGTAAAAAIPVAVPAAAAIQPYRWQFAATFLFSPNRSQGVIPLVYLIFYSSK